MSNLVQMMEQDQVIQTRIQRKEMNYEPTPFPTGDERWRDMFEIKRYDKKIHLYHNPEGKIIYGIARRDFINEAGEKDKQITPFSYCGISKNFVNKQLYSQHSQPYNVHTFPHFNKECKESELLFVEGETTMDAGTKLFPQMISTTASGGITNLKHIDDLSVLQGFRSIIFWADNEKGGKENFLLLAQLVQDNFPEILVKYVDLPRSLPKKWDLANYTSDSGINIYELLNSAVPIKEYAFYNNLKRDSENGRHIFVKSSGDGFHDTLTNELSGEKVLDNLYLRDHSMNVKASKYLQTNDCEVVEGYTFKPTTEQIILIDRKKYLNTYTPVSIENMPDDEVKTLDKDNDIKLMLSHINRAMSQDEFLYKHMLSTIAHDIQHPERNRIWGVLMCSKQGWGKTWLWRLLTAFNGADNTKWIDQEDVVGVYREWMPNCNVVIIDELRREKEKEFISKAKRLFTEKDHRVELKYKNKISFKGHYNFWVSSNEFIPFGIDQEDRRWHILHINETKAELLKAMGDDYFNRLHRLLEIEEDVPNHKFIAKAYAFFKNYKIDDAIFDKNNCPVTSAKEEMKNLSLTQNQKDLNDLRAERKPPFDLGMVSAESILKKVRNNESENRFSSMFRGLNSNEITTWWRDIVGSKKVHGGKTIQLGSDLNRRNYWDNTPNLEWVDCTDIAVMREHMNGNNNPRQKVINFKEKQNDQNRNRGDEVVPF
jgi:hypothetical protein